MQGLFVTKAKNERKLFGFEKKNEVNWLIVGKTGGLCLLTKTNNDLEHE